MGSHRVGHDVSDLAAAAAAEMCTNIESLCCTPKTNIMLYVNCISARKQANFLKKEDMQVVNRYIKTA